MRVAFVSYEVYPFAKVGGLADVAGALPKALKKLGVDVRIIMPKHKVVEKNAAKVGVRIEKIASSIAVPFIQGNGTVDLYRSKLPRSDVEVYMVWNADYFDFDEVYGAPDLGRQAAFFTCAIFSVLKELDWKPDVIHANDWQTGLLPVYLKTNLRDDPFFTGVKTLYTIHNLGYQGVFPKEYLEIAGLPEYLFNIDALEFYGQINYMKGGLVFSDIINTVSPTYAEEIQTPEYGAKLDGILRARSADLYGILNGIDYEEYNPATDKRIYVNFDLDNLAGKYANKSKLQEELGLPVRDDVTLIGVISRLVDQKGFDLVIEVANYLMVLPVQLVILGTGDPRYETFFENLARRYPEKVSANIAFNVELAQKIYAGSDIFLMPSRYEPCGLGQMLSMRYGAIPVVRYTGGLVDTVKEYDLEKQSGNGFGFYEYKSSELLKGLLKAVYYHQQEKDHWKQLMINAMTTDCSWEKSASEYLKLYESTAQ